MKSTARYAVIKTLRILSILFLISISLGCGRFPWSKPEIDPVAAERAQWLLDARFGIEIDLEGMAVAADRIDYEGWVELIRHSGARFVVVNGDSRTAGAILSGLGRECDRQGIRLIFNFETAGANSVEGGSLDGMLAESYEQELIEVLAQTRSLIGLTIDSGDDERGPNAFDRLVLEGVIQRRGDLLSNLNLSAATQNPTRLDVVTPEDWEALPTDQLFGKDRRIGIARDVLSMPSAEAQDGREIVRRLVAAAGHDLVYTLSIRPNDEGLFSPYAQSILSEVGDWLELYGRSVYGTRGGPLPPGGWGVCTSQESRIFIHYLNRRGGGLRFGAGIGEIAASYMFSTGATIDVFAEDGNYAVEIPPRIIDPVDTIIVLEIAPPTPIPE